MNTEIKIDKDGGVTIKTEKPVTIEADTKVQVKEETKPDTRILLTE